VKGLLKILGAIVILAAVFHLATVLYLPRLSMFIACRVIENKAGGANIAFHSEPTTEDNNIVVMQNADTLASWCVYDLSGGPIRITAAIPDSYWSVSLYDMETNNYYVKNDLDVRPAKEVELVIVGPGTGRHGSKDKEEVETVLSPSLKGIVIFRNLVKDKETLPELQKIQKRTRCEKL